MPEEQVREEPEVQVPPFYERFQEERDKRFSSEIARLEAEIRHNGQRLEELSEDVARLDTKVESVRTELREDLARLDGKIDQVRDELKGEIDDLRDELKGEIGDLRDEFKGEITELRHEMQTQFRWMIGLLLPVILGVVAMLIQNLLKP